MKRQKIIDLALLAAYIALIYSTLSITPAIFRFFSKAIGPSITAITDSVFISCLAVLVLLFYRKLKGRGFKSYAGLMAVLSIYGVILCRLTPLTAEKIHLVEYGFLGYLAMRVFRDVRSRDLRYICVIIVIIAIGWGDELIQKVLPGRVYDIRDIYMNILSGLLGLALIRLFTPRPPE